MSSAEREMVKSMCVASSVRGGGHMLGEAERTHADSPAVQRYRGSCPRIVRMDVKVPNFKHGFGSRTFHTVWKVLIWMVQRDALNTLKFLGVGLTLWRKKGFFLLHGGQCIARRSRERPPQWSKMLVDSNGFVFGERSSMHVKGQCSPEEGVYATFTSAASANVVKAAGITHGPEWCNRQRRHRLLIVSHVSMIAIMSRLFSTT